MTHEWFYIDEPGLYETSKMAKYTLPTYSYIKK